MKIIVHGAAGRMGNEVVRLISAENSKNEIAVKVDAFGTGDILTSLALTFKPLHTFFCLS